MQMEQVPSSTADLTQSPAPKDCSQPATSVVLGQQHQQTDEETAVSEPTCTAGSAVFMLPSEGEDDEWAPKARARPEAIAETTEGGEQRGDGGDDEKAGGGGEGEGEVGQEEVGGATSSAAAAAAAPPPPAASASGPPDPESDPALQSVLAAYDHFVEAVAGTEFFQHFADMPLAHTFPMITVAACYGLVASSFAMTLPAQLPAAIFGGLFAGSATSLYQGVVTDPGRIPDEWKESPQREVIHERKKKGAGEEFRFCQKEQKYKPDRAHFCRQLHRNVLRMDHFCPFLANCIGHRNHKHFYLFLLYTALAIVFADVRLFAVAIQGSVHGAPLAAMQQFLVGNGIVVSSVVSAVMVPFVGFHSWLLSRNMTTIEYYETYRSRRHITYDVGLFENIRSVFGDEWWLWLLPVSGPSTSGLSYPVRPAPLEEDDDNDDLIEPGASGASSSTEAVAAAMRPHQKKKFSDFVKEACGPLPILPGAACAAEEIFGDFGKMCAGFWTGATLRWRNPACKGFPDGFTGSERQRPEARAEDAARVHRIAEISWAKSGRKPAHQDAEAQEKAEKADHSSDRQARSTQ